MIPTHICDVEARIYRDGVSKLNSQITSDSAIYSSDSVIHVVLSESNQDRISSLLALHENCITKGELERLYGVIGETNNGIVIIRCIANTGE